jgi:hypothetical protein
MKTAVVFGCGILLTAGLVGCGRSADTVVKDLLAAMDENVSIGEDRVQSGKIDLGKLEKVGLRIRDLNEQLAAMPKAEVEAAKEKYKDEFAKIAARKKALDSGIPQQKPRS